MEALRKMETFLENNKSDAIKQIGASYAGESALMVENADFAFSMGMEFKESTNTKYLNVKLLASRTKNTFLNYFVHPFENGNGMKLQEDFDLDESLSLKDLSDDLANFDSNNPTADNNQIKVRTRKIPTNKDLIETEGVSLFDDGETMNKTIEF